MKRKLLFFAPILALIVLAGCGSLEAVVEGKLNPRVVHTVGNHSYLVLNLEKPENDYLAILEALNAFENGYPELEVISWRIQNGQDRVYGLWIDHKPKAK